MGTLYIVATPIGNLKDITLRAMEVLKSVNLILAEDTRQTGLLLKHLEISKPLLSYQEHNELQRIPEVIKKLKNGLDIALVSDAGTPTLADPGFKLVRECIKKNISVVAIPGSSAILTALVVSGLPTDKFLYLGYLPKKSGKRRKILQNIISIYQYIKMSAVFFESPYRILQTLKDMLEILGDRQVVICRELTKVYEEVQREKISEAIKHFEEVKPKGEFTVLI